MPTSKRLREVGKLVVQGILGSQSPLITEMAGSVARENRPIRITYALFPHSKLRFVADAGLDDQKIFQQMDQVHAEFIIRATHNRLVEVYNDRLDRWQ